MAVGAHAVEGAVEIFHVDRHVMHSLAVTIDKAAHEIVIGIRSRALQEFELEACHVDMRQHKVALRGAAHRIVHDFARKVTPEEFHRGIDVAHCDRNVVETRETVVVRTWRGPTVVERLPQLNQNAKGRTRRDEAGLLSIRKVVLVNYAHAAGFELSDHRIKAIDFVTDVMQPFAVTPDELRDETLVARQLLDELERNAAEIEILPQEAALRLLACLFV